LHSEYQPVSESKKERKKKGSVVYAEEKLFVKNKKINLVFL
jgi:hypothetical protein